MTTTPPETETETWRCVKPGDRVRAVFKDGDKPKITIEGEVEGYGPVGASLGGWFIRNIDGGRPTVLIDIEILEPALVEGALYGITVHGTNSVMIYRGEGNWQYLEGGYSMFKMFKFESHGPVLLAQPDVVLKWLGELT